MEYLLMIATILAGIYTYTFARWLQRGGNTTGALGMYAMVAASLALAVYRIAGR